MSNASTAAPLRVGVIGLGSIGTDMVEAADGLAEASVVAAADLGADAVARHRAARPAIRYTTDPDEVIAAADVDAVYIATPPATHAALTVAALKRGLPVFCEKPLSVDEADARVMLAAAETSGAVTAVNFALSDRHAVLEVERALRAGELGEPSGVDVRLEFPRWPRDFQAAAAWVDSREQGGFVREVFSHFAYLADRLLGPLEPRYATRRFGAAGAEAAAFGSWRAGGVPVHLSGFAGVAGAETYDFILWGTERSYLLRDWDRLYASEGGPWEPVPLSGPRGGDGTRLARFARAVRGEAVTGLADFAAAYRVQRVVEAFDAD